MIRILNQNDDTLNIELGVIVPTWLNEFKLKEMSEYDFLPGVCFAALVCGGAFFFKRLMHDENNTVAVLLFCYRNHYDYLNAVTLFESKAA